MVKRKSLLDLASDLVGLGRTRLELLLLEASLETVRLLKVLGCALGAFLFFTLAFVLLSVLIGVYFWPTDERYWALGGVAAVYAVIGLFLLYLLRRYLTRGPGPFAATLQELTRDLQILERARVVKQEEEQVALQQKNYRTTEREPNV